MLILLLPIYFCIIKPVLTEHNTKMNFQGRGGGFFNRGGMNQMGRGNFMGGGMGMAGGMGMGMGMGQGNSLLGQPMMMNQNSK